MGNKSDQINSRQVSQKDAEDYCKKQNVKHYLCSAKNGSGIEKLFEEFIKGYL